AVGVSTHAHARWATGPGHDGATRAWGFNPRPRTVGDFRRSTLRRNQLEFQPTPTHGGRLRPAFSSASTCAVSTHAHARWATTVAAGVRVGVIVSTHAHARWATWLFGVPCTPRSRFNPRPRTVGDFICALISVRFSCFNPRPRTVGDTALLLDLTWKRQFQPTPTHGGRPTRCSWGTSTILFQPTPTHGGRLRLPDFHENCIMFQPTPTHGGRHRAMGEGYNALLFQPTPTHGGRLCLPETLKNKEKIAIMRESVVKEK